MEKVLVLAPHTDDGELGCGGTICRYTEGGASVHYAAFSTARTSVRTEYPEDILKSEVREATTVLGIAEGHLHIYDFPVRKFPNHRQEILQQIIDLRNEIEPTIVFVPSPNDIHQDHQVIAQEGLRAFKRHTLLGYEEPWNNIVFETRCFIPLHERHIERKIEALKCYRSQGHRKYLDAEFIRGLAKTRGTQIEGGYAEAFEVLRWIHEDVSGA